MDLKALQSKSPIVKAAMSERLADRKGYITPEYLLLYSYWSEYCTHLITGHFMISEDCIAESGNVIVRNDDKFIAGLQDLRNACSGKTLIIQLNHCGRQVPKSLVFFRKVKAISPYPRAINFAFAQPEALTPEKLVDIIAKFYDAAATVLPFCDGVEIHCAHGYLLSEVLSKQIANDEYLGIVSFLFKKLKANYPNKIIATKLNLGDFNDIEHFTKIVDAIESDVDLIEVSGGSYNDPIFLSENPRHELFKKFIKSCADQSIKNKLMFTGGIRTKKDIDDILKSGVLVGIGRPFCIDPFYCNKIATDELITLRSVPKFHPFVEQVFNFAERVTKLNLLKSVCDVIYCQHAMKSGTKFQAKLTLWESLKILFLFIISLL